MFLSRPNDSAISLVGGTQRAASRRFFPPPDPDLDHLELSFLRVVGRNGVPMAAADDIQLDTSATEAGSLSQFGATMQVCKGTWNGQRVAVKHIRKDHVGDSYKRALRQVNYELQLMSKPSLRRHRNITKLLAVCFDDGDPSAVEPSISVVRPGLLVELAHEQYPDLRYFFDRGASHMRPNHLPFETSASLVADIADGITALHDHDIVHADLKPENVLIFPDSQCPGNVVAKIADFGYVGMTVYNNAGVRAPHPESRPGGGTAEWSAPECLQHPDYYRESGSLEHPSYQSCIDIYSFGLLSCYIALDGQTPLEYVPNLSESKLSDSLLGKVVAKLKEYYRQGIVDGEGSFEEVAISIAHETLRLDSESRIQSLRSIRPMLFGTGVTPRGNEKFVLNFNLFPQSAHEFRCQGLYDAYWSSPPAFRAEVLKSFQRISSGPFGQYVAPEVWACLTKEPKV
ncbi:hypothetical protein MFIFM68171_09840 [Madurella fahalii]|uniref:Protein kinase domain-containing protein n=1 Tax=Madurella fahalii TaxID=1157608 RepID=A0ABQ0GPH5_9PEZI